MEQGILLLAYNLSMLSFFTGVLIYALPIPWYPLKRWAPRLMIDSLVAAALALSFYTLLGASDMVARALGGSWDLFYKWLKTSTAVVAGMKAFVIAIKLLASKFTILEALKSQLRPIDRLADAGLYVVAWIWGLKLIIKDFGSMLAAIGVALMAVPFRISRSAGAWLFSFVLVFNAGLQVLPVFLSTVAEAPGRPDPSQLEEYGLAFARVLVTDRAGDRVEGGLVHMYNPSWKEWGRYKVDLLGQAVDDHYGGFIPVPTRIDTYWILEVDGVYFPLKPYPLRPTDYTGSGGLWNANLSNPYLVWAGPYAIAYANTTITGVKRVGDTITVSLEAEGPSSLTLRVPKNCNATLLAPGASEKAYTWYWRGLNGIAYEADYGSPGHYNASITIHDCSPHTPDLGSTVNYLDKVGKIGTYTDLDFIEAFLLYYLTIPFLYIFILFAITTGLARLLGGRERLPIRL